MNTTTTGKKPETQVRLQKKTCDLLKEVGKKGESYDRIIHRLLTEWEYIGTITVDAGMVQVGDPGYYNARSIAEMREAWNSDDGAFWDQEKFHDLVVPLEHDESAEWARKHDLLAGIIVQSGYGDGAYDVYAKFIDKGKEWGARVAAVKVEFFDDEYKRKPEKNEP